jgi:PAS domain S-box-containing protein
MDKEENPNKNLTDELESIRAKIARLQGLIQQSQAQDPEQTPAESDNSGILQSDKRLLEKLINSSVDGILAFNRDLCFTVWNPSMERLFGIGAKNILGRYVFEACPFLKELGEDRNFEAALKGEKTISRNRRYPIPGTAKQGYFESYYGPIYDIFDGGNVIGGLAIIRDVTERSLAEERRRISEEQYREIFENACDMVYTYDLLGRITTINRAAERLTGYTRSIVRQPG